MTLEKLPFKIRKYLGHAYPYNIESKPKNIPEIIFLAPARNKPTGGIKVIYQQAEAMQEIAKDQFKVSVFHPKNVNFTCDWFIHQAPIKRSFNFSISDVIVIPETMVSTHAPLFDKLGLRYIIYVQNGYFIHKGNETTLKAAYVNALLICCISEDAINCVKNAHPNVDKNSLIRIHYMVNSSLFKCSLNKKNLITYMPRKLVKHVELVCNFLEPLLPSNWQLVPISNKSEHETANILSESKIFLSFSEFEGCPLPPLEAALSGNIVVGYTGEGAKEYFRTPIFNEVYCGDILNFVRTILNIIRKIEDGSLNLNEINEQRGMLAGTFSNVSQSKDLAHLIEKICSIKTNKVNLKNTF